MMECQYTISFDMDGTLVRNFFIEAVIPHLFYKFAEPLSLQGIHSPANLINAMKSIHLKRLKAGQSIKAFDWDANFKLLLGSRLESDKKPFEKALFEALSASKPTVYPDVRVTLSRLIQDHPLKLIILSNGYIRYQAPILEATDLKKYFAHIYTSDSLRTLKSGKEAFLKVKAEVPNYLLHCGDKLIDDVKGANRAGLKSIWINRLIDLGDRKYFTIGEEALEHVRIDMREILPDFIITSLYPVPMILKEISLKRET